LCRSPEPIRTALLYVSLLAASVAIGGDADGARLPDHFLVGGIQVHEDDLEHWSGTLTEAGLNTVAVTAYARQGKWDSAELRWADEEAAVLEEIRVAKRRGLSVALILRVAVDHSVPENKFIWHGMIMPGSDEEIRRWFERYGEFVAKWAEISEKEGVDLLGIGSEMKALTQTLPLNRKGHIKHHYGFTWYQRLQKKRAHKYGQTLTDRHFWVRGHANYETLESFANDRFRYNMAWAKQAHLRPGTHTMRRVNRRRALLNESWSSLIARTRLSYSGPLTYAANFDNYHNVGFWMELDVVGINSYFSLRANLDQGADPADQPTHFRKSWAAILDDIESFKRDQGVAQHPVVFTELGYTFRRHGTVEPWAHDGFSVVGWKGKKKQLVIWEKQPIDLGERRRAIRALREEHQERESSLAGILYWKLSSDVRHQEIEPFVCHIGSDSADGLREELAAFADVPRP